MSEAVDAILREFSAGGVPPGIAVMRLILATSNPAELQRVLDAASRSSATVEDRQRMGDLAELLRASPRAWETVHATAATVSHSAEPISAEAMVQRLAQSFDAAARTSPEASVALYSLGDASQLERATSEIVAWLRAQDMLGVDREILDLGCGIGRLELAVAGEARRIVGLDVSPEMIRIATERCAAVANVEFRVTSGLNLHGRPNASFDAVIAADIFPYLVQAGGNLAATHIAESARVLRPGGGLAILNYSYRGTPELDRRELQQAAVDAGLDLLVAGEKPFRSWDATVFRLHKPR